MTTNITVNILLLTIAGLFPAVQPTDKCGETWLPAVLEWQVSTNWIDEPYTMTTLMAWSGDKDPNITTHFESGTVYSNLIAFVVWKGAVHAVTLESIVVTNLSRSYTIKTTTERVYPSGTPGLPWHDGTTHRTNKL